MITFNEEKNLPRTLESIRWVDEIIIIDSGSTDRTPDIAASFGVRFFTNRDFRGHGEQKNIAIGRCQSEWILLLDADEVIPTALAAEIRATLSDPEHDAFWIPRLNLFMSRWMRHGGLYPDHKLRLFRRNTATLEEGGGPHATPQFSGKSAGKLKNHFLHYAYPDFYAYLEHMNRYSSELSLSKAQTHTAPSGILFLRSILNPLFDFLANYVGRLGFLDSVEGLVFHISHASYVHWKYAKAWERSLRSEPPPRREKPML